MGVRTRLSNITLTAADGIADANGMLQAAILSLTETIMKLTAIEAMMTAAGDTTNADTLATQIKNLS